MQQKDSAICLQSSLRSDKSGPEYRRRECGGAKGNSDWKKGEKGH